MSASENHLPTLQQSYERKIDIEKQLLDLWAEATKFMDDGFYDQDFEGMADPINLPAAIHRLLKAREAATEQLKRLRTSCIRAQQRTGSK